MKKLFLKILWFLLGSYYSIFLIPLISLVNKNTLYLSFCYLNYLISKLINTKIYIINDYKPGKKIILSNHVSMYDITISTIIQIYYNKVIEFCLKKEVIYFPGLGWWCKIMNFPVLQRKKNSADLDTLKNHKTNNSILIYPEGTRFSKKKYIEASNFAKKNNIKHSKYTLVPKSTGAYHLINNNDIVWVTVSILIYLDKNGTIINNSTINLPDIVILYNKNYPIAEIPKTVYQFRKWLQDEFYKMNEIQNIKRPKNPIIVNPTFAVKLLTFITFIYPIILLVYFLI